MAYGKKNKVSPNLQDYNLMFSGPSKIGKTTLIRKYCEKLVGEDGYLFLETGSERGADAIEGINYINVPDWNSQYDDLDNSIGMKTLIDDIVTNKASEYPDLKIVVIDTLDHWIDIADAETIRIWNQTAKDKSKKAKSIAQAFAGYGRGEDKSIELMLEVMSRLRKVGIQTIVIGHCKNKTITDPITGTSYDTVTSNQGQKYYNAIVNNLHFNAISYIKRDIVEEATGKKDFNGNEKYTHEVVGKERRIMFRDPNHVIDAGGRFADIVDEIDFDADELIKAMTDAIKAEQSKSGRSIEDDIKEREAKEAEITKRVEEAETAAKAQKELEENIEKIVSFVKQHLKDEEGKKIMSMCKEMGYANPTLIATVEDSAKFCDYIDSLK